jgi:hypothetical protein
MEQMFKKLGGARMEHGDYLARFGCPSAEHPFGDRVFTGMAKMHMKDDGNSGGVWYSIQGYKWFTAPKPFSEDNARLPVMFDATAPTSTSDWFSPAAAGAPSAIDWFLRYPCLVIEGTGGPDTVYIRCLAIIIRGSGAWLSHTSRLSPHVR